MRELEEEGGGGGVEREEREDARERKAVQRDVVRREQLVFEWSLVEGVALVVLNDHEDGGAARFGDGQLGA